jgi:hypothetical protein
MIVYLVDLFEFLGNSSSDDIGKYCIELTDPQNAEFDTNFTILSAIGMNI